jgi:5-methylcytosine-specific restriction protein A
MHDKKIPTAWEISFILYTGECLTHGRYVPVEEVHHIIPLSEGRTNDEENLESLCRSYNEKIHGERGDR